MRDWAYREHRRSDVKKGFWRNLFENVHTVNVRAFERLKWTNISCWVNKHVRFVDTVYSVDTKYFILIWLSMQ